MDLSFVADHGAFRHAFFFVLVSPRSSSSPEAPAATTTTAAAIRPADVSPSKRQPNPNNNPASAADAAAAVEPLSGTGSCPTSVSLPPVSLPQKQEHQEPVIDLCCSSQEGDDNDDISSSSSSNEDRIRALHGTEAGASISPPATAATTRSTFVADPAHGAEDAVALHVNTGGRPNAHLSRQSGNGSSTKDPDDIGGSYKGFYVGGGDDGGVFSAQPLLPGAEGMVRRAHGALLLSAGGCANRAASIEGYGGGTVGGGDRGIGSASSVRR